MQEELFKIVIGMWLEVNICSVWTIGQVVDMSSDGKSVWVETHEDTYKVNRLEGRLRMLEE